MPKLGEGKTTVGIGEFKGGNMDKSTTPKNDIERLEKIKRWYSEEDKENKKSILDLLFDVKNEK